MKKPPLGLMPHYIWKENRIAEIKAAMKRYSKVRKAIPEEWKTELLELNGVLAKARKTAETFILNDVPSVATTNGQKVLEKLYGTPYRFAKGCIAALGEISWTEAMNAIDKYRDEWNEA